MESRAAFYFANGLAASSQKTYKSGENRYLSFCTKLQCLPLPLTESTLCKFVSYLADEPFQFRTIKMYLSGLRFFQIKSGHGDPFSAIMPRLDYVLKGVKRVQATMEGNRRERLPITPDILRKLKGIWASTSSDPDSKLIWAACCLCFFAFLRVGEMTTPDAKSYDPGVHLCLSDVAVDSARNPSFVRISIKQSKTDPFRRGICLFVGRTDAELCPVAAILSFLLCRGSAPGPLFRFASGEYLTRKRFVELVRAALTRAGIDQSKYCGHSFRIGAATTAAARGIEDSIIKTLGRWESVAYLQYVRIPRERLTQYSRVLGSP